MKLGHCCGFLITGHCPCQTITSPTLAHFALCIIIFLQFAVFSVPGSSGYVGFKTLKTEKWPIGSRYALHWRPIQTELSWAELHTSWAVCNALEIKLRDRQLIGATTVCVLYQNHIFMSFWIPREQWARSYVRMQYACKPQNNYLKWKQSTKLSSHNARTIKSIDWLDDAECFFIQSNINLCLLMLKTKINCLSVLPL